MRRRLRRPGRLGPGFVPFAAAMRSLGAATHFDPSWGASDNGTTSQWVDRIGGAVVQSVSAGTRLTYSQTTINNRPGWVGDGARYLRGSALPALAAASHTIYFVAKATSIGAVQMVCGAGSSTAQEVYGFGLGASGAYNTRRRATAVVDSFAGVILEVANAPHVQSVVNTAGASVAHSNGGVTQTALAYAAAPAALNLFSVGALFGYVAADALWQPFTGSIGDVIIFPTAHTNEQRRYVEQLIAAKYGWPCIQGVSGFTAPNFLETGVNLGIRGASGVGVWADYFMRWDAIPTSEFVGVAGAGVTGHTCYTSAGIQYFRIGNNTALFVSPGSTIAANDVGKALLFGGCSDLSFARAFKNGVEVGAGTACAGYTADASTKYQISDGAPTVSMTLFGVAGGNVPQTAGNQAARAAAIKAALGFVHTGGATPTHAWKTDGLASSYADLVGSDSLNLTAGQLAAAQIIIPTWPW